MAGLPPRGQRGLALIVFAILATGLSLLLTNPVLPAILTPILVVHATSTGLPPLPVLII
jgi:hypothetical protein